jgi:flavin-dependent dehydrogenase
MRGAERQTAWLAAANVQFADHEPCGENGVLRCGDAAGYIDSLAGDGMAMAARSGELGAAVINAHLKGSLNIEKAAELYVVAWKREFAARLAHAQYLRQLLLRPASASAAIKIVKHAPGLARYIVRSTRGRIEAV